MVRDGFDDELAALRADVVEMGDVVVERLETALMALEERDAALAREVVDGDDEINELYLDLESDCIDLFALQQPLAGDLRFVAASFKILTDLERIADLAVNVGSYTLARDHELVPDVDLLQIGELAVEMVEDALAAYAEEDADACVAVADRDDELDALCERVGELVVRHLTSTDDDPTTEWLFTEVTKLLLTVRDIERVGDHAVNVAARTLYLIDNDPDLLY
ncbi:phosphate signaling complex protein PhoU [Halomicrococcus gelatinilyticus]|uniref:phosphate signaling complex protein PhoU n=1 Tax=Halomicrococcus gelatinilyticus TaxID=1702103 RepID=UPI002E149B61